MTDTPTQTTNSSLHATDLPVPLELLQTRKEFEKIIYTKLQNSTSQNLYEWRTREWIENQIKEIEEIEISQKYRVEEILGIKVLRIARDVRGKNLQIIPVEDYFDVIYAAHIFTGHGGIDSLKEYLENRKLYLPYKALTCFLKLCEACNAVRSQNPFLFRIYHGFLELIDLSGTPDGEMKFLMHYRALKLRRVFLRSLSSSNAADVAEELLELFGQIGPPRVLHTPTISFTKALILRLAIIYPDCKVICGREMELEEKTKDIKANLVKWMACNNTNEWSKGIIYMTGYEIRRKQLKLTQESEEFAIDMNLPGPSSMHQDASILKKRAHGSYLQKNLSAAEVLKLLNPNKTYSKITPQTIPLKQVEAPEIPKKVYKTYTRTKKEKSQIIVPTDDNKEEPHGKRALCIDTNLRDIVKKPTKCMKKFHDVWNSTLDLPDQTATKVKNIIGINIMDSTNFGTIPKESCDLHIDILHNKEGQLSLPYEDNSDALGSKNIKEGESYLKTSADFSTLESTEEKKEMLYFEFEDFNEEKPCLEVPVDLSALESKEIKKEPLCFETSTGCNALKNNGIKEEDFGTIVKVESLVE